MNHCAQCSFWLPNRPEFKIENAGLCLNPKINAMTLAELGCAHFVGSEHVLVNVPQHTRKGIDMQSNGNLVDGPVEILIVTYWKDQPWLEYCLRSIQKFCTGFQGVTIATPYRDAHERVIDEDWIKQIAARGDIRMHAHYYEEVPGKGMLGHMIKMAEAEQVVPRTTKYVLTCDADCIFIKPTTPEDYFCQDKPYYLVREWASLIKEDPRNPGAKVVSDCLQWKAPTDAQLGFDTTLFTMAMNTNVYPIDFFPKYRAHVSSVHGDYTTYMLSGRNEFPQDRMDFTAMGAYAHQFMRDRFLWIDVEKGPYPLDRKKAYHSHSGLTTAIRDEIEKFLNTYHPTPEEEARMAS